MSSLRAKYMLAMRFQPSNIAADKQVLKFNSAPKLYINTAICQTYSSPSSSPTPTPQLQQQVQQVDDTPTPTPIVNTFESSTSSSSITPPSTQPAQPSCSRVLFSPVPKGGKRKASDEIKEDDSKKVKVQDEEQEEDISSDMFLNMCELESMKLVLALRSANGNGANGNEFMIKSIYKQSVSRLLMLINSMEDIQDEDHLLALAMKLRKERCE
jgi:hypothetical protein